MPAKAELASERQEAPKSVTYVCTPPKSETDSEAHRFSVKLDEMDKNRGMIPYIYPCPKPNHEGLMGRIAPGQRL